MKKSKKLLPLVFLALFSAAAGFVFQKTETVKSIDNILTDFNIRYFAPPTKVSEEIVIVFLDEATMKGLPYRSPVPRDFLKKLNDKILEGDPKAVGYDIYFKDPTTPAIDSALAESFRKGPTFSVSVGRKDDKGVDFEDPPMNLFEDSFKGVGLSDLPFNSSDSVIRSAKLKFNFGREGKESFVAELFKAATGKNAETVFKNSKIRIFRVQYFADPRIRFVGPPSKQGDEKNLFSIFPANLVVDGLIPSEWFKDKIVLVGAAYDDGTDAYLTPYYSAKYNYERMSGVEIHANILNQLLSGEFYYSPAPGILILSVFFLAFLAVFLFSFGPIYRGTVFLILLIAAPLVKSIFLFNKYGIIIPVAQYELLTVFAFGASLGYRSITEGRQKRFIKSVFARYVPSSVVEKMIEDPSLLVLGGETREITAIFTDIAGFTSISEKLEPAVLVKFLNDYLDRLTKIIFKYGGTLDKYEGDAIISFFGAPVSLKNHKEAALLAALEMQKETKDVSDKWKNICQTEIITRIGVNSGLAVVGNMGSELRFDYTAIGDTMNLASRLEGANKFFNTRILASENSIADGIVVAPVARLRVKGKEEPVLVYEVLGVKSEFTKEDSERLYKREIPKEIIELKSK